MTATADTATASAAVELLHQTAMRTSKMARHLADWAHEMADDVVFHPRREAELRETLATLHDELEGVMERLGRVVVFEKPAEE